MRNHQKKEGPRTGFEIRLGELSLLPTKHLSLTSYVLPADCCAYSVHGPEIQYLGLNITFARIWYTKQNSMPISPLNIYCVSWHFFALSSRFTLLFFGVAFASLSSSFSDDICRIWEGYL
jgi:hypothetical protein